MNRALSSERHWFVLGIFALAVAAGYGYLVLTQPQPRLQVASVTDGYGSLVVETDPTGALVEVAGDKFITPIQIDGLLGGRHELKVSFDGAEPVTQTVTVRPPGVTMVFVAPKP